MNNRQKQPPNRKWLSAYKQYLSGLALAVTVVTAQGEVLFSENFDSGLGQFQSQGRVYSSSGSVSLRGGGSAATQISSGAISVNGAQQLTLSYYRDIRGFDNGEALTAATKGRKPCLRLTARISYRLRPFAPGQGISP